MAGIVGEMNNCEESSKVWIGALNMVQSALPFLGHHKPVSTTTLSRLT